MKRVFCTLLAALCLVTAHSQVPAEYRGVFRLYDFDAPVTDSKAPKGYKAVGISHYGRHGARYQDRTEQYTIVADIFSAAEKAGILSGTGRNCWEKLKPLMPEFIERSGDLTEVGEEQLRRLGGRMYASYPDIFRRNPVVYASSSTVQRCMMSMVNFCDGMKAGNPRLDIRKRLDSRDMAFINPYGWAKSHGNEIVPCLEAKKQFFNDYVDYKGLYATLFTDPDRALKLGDYNAFTRHLYKIACGMQCTVHGDVNIDKAFTAEQLECLCSSESFRFWVEKGMYPADAPMCAHVRPLVDEIIARAEEDLSSERPVVRLRFGHDGIIQAFLSYLHIGTWGDYPSDFRRITEVGNNSAIPMAANIRFVFFRNKGGDVIFKFQINESDVALPLKEAFAGCYYRWSDFTAYARNLNK